MVEEVKNKWLAALRSGEYTQGKHMLKSETGKYCCMGVLCDLAEKEGLVTTIHSPDHYDFAIKYVVVDDRSDYSLSVLPHVVMEWAGLDEPDPTIEAEQTSLSYLNDVREQTFNEIADLIEEHL